MAALIKLRQFPLMQRCVLNNYSRMCRNISTSNNKNNTCEPVNPPCEEPKNWVSYGFDYTDQKEDTNHHHASFFFSITLCMVFGGFAWAYAPDVHMRDWAQREAFLELRRRERAGLRPIDPNYIPPKYMKLPSESQLTDVEIII